MSSTYDLRKWIVRIFWPIFFLALWQVLLRAENPALMTDDSGETVAAAATLGICHSPGYPLHSLMGRLATFVPLGTPAFRLNLLSALFMLLALWFVMETCRNLSRKFALDDPQHPGAPLDFFSRELSLIFIALSLLFCQSVFAQCLTAKGGLYTFALLNIAVLAWAGLQAPPRIKTAWIVFIWSVGLGCHWQTQILLAVFLGVRFFQTAAFRSVKKILLAGSFALIGLSTYLFLPLRAALSPALNWLNPQTWNSFLAVVLRRDATSEEFIVRPLREYSRNILEYFQVMGRHWWPGFALLAAAGAWFFFRRHPRWAWVLAAGYAIFVALVLEVSHFEPPFDIYLEAIFLVSTQVFPALFGFIGLLFICDRLKRAGPRAVFAACLILALCAAGWGAWVFKRQEKSRYTLAYDYGVNLLKELPRDALVLLDTDLLIMPWHYLKQVEGMRGDVSTVPIFMLYSGWGWKQVSDANKGKMTFPEAVGSFQDALPFLTNPARFKSSAVFYSHDKPILERYRFTELAGRLYPWGLTYRLGEKFPESQEISPGVWEVSKGRRLRNLDSTRDLRETEYSYTFYQRGYARSHVATGYLLLQKGLLYPALAQDLRALALFPGQDGVYLNLVVYFESAGYLEMAGEFCRKEIAVAPLSADVYFAYGNILSKMGSWDEAIKAYDRSLEIKPDFPAAQNNRIETLRMKNQPPADQKVAKRNAGDYLELGKKYEKDAQAYLASMAFDIARNIK
jgi:hypothetical protein